MKLSEAMELYNAGSLRSAELLPNPSDHQQWFIMVTGGSGKSFIIADEDDNPIVTGQLEELFKTLKALGFRKAQITF